MLGMLAGIRTDDLIKTSIPIQIDPKNDSAPRAARYPQMVAHVERLRARPE